VLGGAVFGVLQVAAAVKRTVVFVERPCMQLDIFFLLPSRLTGRPAGTPTSLHVHGGL
jgi:hypothetical protein